MSKDSTEMSLYRVGYHLIKAVQWTDPDNPPKGVHVDEHGFAVFRFARQVGQDIQEYEEHLEVGDWIVGSNNDGSILGVMTNSNFETAYHPVKTDDWDYETCKRCGNRNTIGFDVPDKIWKKVVDGRYNVLCLNCFDTLASLAKVKYADELVIHPPITWEDGVHKDE